MKNRLQQSLVTVSSQKFMAAFETIENTKGRGAISRSTAGQIEKMANTLLAINGFSNMGLSSNDDEKYQRTDSSLYHNEPRLPDDAQALTSEFVSKGVSWDDAFDEVSDIAAEFYSFSGVAVCVEVSSIITDCIELSMVGPNLWTLDKEALKAALSFADLSDEFDRALQISKTLMVSGKGAIHFGKTASDRHQFRYELVKFLLAGNMTPSFCIQFQHFTDIKSKLDSLATQLDDCSVAAIFGAIHNNISAAQNKSVIGSQVLGWVKKSAGIMLGTSHSELVAELYNNMARGPADFVTYLNSTIRNVGE